MLGTKAISNLLSETKVDQSPSIIETERKEGTQLMDQAILEHLISGIRDGTEACMRASSKQPFARYPTDKTTDKEFV
ncbi:MAG: hypothetical protein BMS9Abin29_2285 [Gemmatimonadota bacterium]|nr:MAG: hypothetical protein BMS9Abin29_2285 [Gemmatimonadota bacterium]